MKLARSTVLHIMIGIAMFLTGCGTIPGQLPPTKISIVTPGPLTNTVQYWDLGISMNYPVDWAMPEFSSGQITLARSTNISATNLASEPVISLGVVDYAQLKLPPNATLQMILAAIMLGPEVEVREANAANFAGLDAAYMTVRDKRQQVSGYGFTFRVPDGRVGSMIALAPSEIWADLAPDIEKMRLTAKLIKPADFKLPTFGKEIATVPAAGISFTLPDGWLTRDFQQARIYHDRDIPEYADASGYANGPMLVLRVRKLDQGVSVRDALTQLVSVRPTDTISDIAVGLQRGVQIFSFDPVTSQGVTFVAFASQDKSAMVVFRWTTPGILFEATRPTFDTILRSVQYGLIR